MKKIGVLLADDHAVVRQGLRALLEAEGDIAVVGEAENGRQAVAQAKKILPDVVVMDVAMPGMNGLEATRQIVRNIPSSKVLVLTSYGDDDYVAQLLEAGATGYLVKQTAAADLLKAIREVHHGNAFFSPSIAKRLRQQESEALAGGQPAASTGQIDFPRGRGAAIGRRRLRQQADRSRAVHQHQDRREASPAGDEQVEHPRHRRADPLRDGQRLGRAQRSGNCLSRTTVVRRKFSNESLAIKAGTPVGGR